MTGLVIGVGNPQRGDDGFGPAVAELLRSHGDLRVVVSDGEPARLIELFRGADLVVLVDAERGAGPVGQWRELRLEQLASWPSTSSHRFSLVETVGLAAAMGWLPQTLVVLAASGAEFGPGVGLSAGLAGAVAPVAARAAAIVRDEGKGVTNVQHGSPTEGAHRVRDAQRRNSGHRQRHRGRAGRGRRGGHGPSR